MGAGWLKLCSLRGWCDTGHACRQLGRTFNAPCIAAACPRPAPAVFDVDVQEGAAPLKLALNRGDNPYLVVDRFLEEHSLPDTYK